MGLLGSIGGGTKGFLTNLPLVNNFFNQSPAEQGFKAPEESADLQDMRHHVDTQANASEEDLVGRQMAGLDPNAFNNSIGDQQRFSSALGGPNAMGEAISNKAKKNFDSGFNRTKRGIELDAGKYRFDRMNAGIAPALQQNEAMRQAAMRQAEAESAKYAARSNAIKSVFGTAGAVVGGLAGGPLGAQVGAQAGGGSVNSASYS